MNTRDAASGALLALALGCGCTSSTAPAPDAGAFEAGAPPPLFSDHGMPPGTDVRFRGVGQLLALAPGGFTSGIQRGLRGAITTTTGPSFGLAMTGEDLYTLYLLRLPGAVVFETTFHPDGIDCPDILSEAVSGGNVVLGMGGDPGLADAACTLMWVRRLAGGPQYQTVYRRGLTAAALLDSLRDTDVARSFVVTALSPVDGGYAYVASRVPPQPGAALEQFETRMETAALGELATQAEALSAAGFVITAAVWNGNNLTLLGTRAAGTSRTLTAKVDSELLSPDVGPALASQLAQGYAPVSLTYSHASSDLRMYLIGQKARSP